MTVPGRVAMHLASTGKPGLKVLTTETIARTRRTSMKALSLYALSPLRFAYSSWPQQALSDHCDVSEYVR